MGKIPSSSRASFETAVDRALQGRMVVSKEVSDEAILKITSMVLESGLLEHTDVDFACGAGFLLVDVVYVHLDLASALETMGLWNQVWTLCDR
eukprot:SAG31_NODE_21034_length_559_cov_1.108696_2_plen_92_part_01